MSNNQPPGYGYPSDPQNPYGQQPQSPYGQQPQDPYGQQPPTDQQAYGYPQGAPGQPPGYGQQANYGQPGQQSTGWLGQPNPYGPPAPGTRQLASAGDRFLARLIDLAVLIIPFILIQFLVAIAAGEIIATVVGGILVFGYEGAMLLTQNQQTIGKKAMKLRVVSLAHGGRPTDNELWTRAAVYGLPGAVYCVGSLFSLVNVLWLLWDKPYQQCLHDKAAKTVVVKEG
ncbi:RDD family protein [Kitasatospora sp. NBC_01287]|uniref:RDD family protein n=1 Tax=Kitasatospora sp. NBC_01287 TaxID=2903573 RepID=UPI00224D59B4|nr:RDD family protein [Kitasatospora sp. NBC_01287]MCX4749629.1 RDD family protein [Kitasatospora sp. NBC_01287]